MSIDYAVLKNELLSDPKGLGYAGKTDSQCAELLNQVRENGDPKQEKVDRDLPVEKWELVNATVDNEWGALSAANKERFRILLDAAPFDYRLPGIRAMAATAFGAGTVTRTNLIALQQRPGSRGEFLFGQGTYVSHDDVRTAKAL